MVINGVELQFDLYDADSTEMRKRYFSELEKMKTIEADSKKIQDEQAQVKFLCGRIKGMFDTVFGEGTGEKVCTNRNSLMICMNAYEKLVHDQIRQDKEYQAILQRLKGNHGRNRK